MPECNLGGKFHNVEILIKVVQCENSEWWAQKKRHIVKKKYDLSSIGHAILQESLKKLKKYDL